MIAQHNIDHDVNLVKLKTVLSDAHRQQLAEYTHQIDIADNRIALARIHNKIANLYLQSIYYMQSPDYNSILFHANRAALLTKGDTITKAKKEYLQALGWLGTCYVDLGNTSKAFEYFNEILVETENVQKPSMFYAHRQLATTEKVMIYAAQGSLDIAITGYQSLLGYVEKNQIDENNISAIVYMKLAGFYRQQKKMKEAYYFANEALEVACLNRFDFREAMAYLELAAIELDLGRYREGELFLAKAYHILKESDYVSLLSKYYIIKSDLASTKGNVMEQVCYAEKAFALMKNNSFTKEYIQLGQLLSKIYNKAENFEKAYKVLAQTMIIEKKIANKEELKKGILRELQRKDHLIAFEQKQHELEQARGEAKNFIIISIGLLFILAMIVICFALKDREKKIKLARLLNDKNDELNKLNMAKSSFFANISHEFRTPLTLISSPIQQLLDNEKNDITPEVKNTLQRVSRNTIKLQKRVNEILELSSLESNNLELRAQSIELSSFLHIIFSSFEAFEFQKFKIDYSYVVNHKPPNYFLVDDDKLEKIISNLISNAFKYSRSGDQITVTATIDTDVLLIDIKDTGMGICKKELPYIFDRFYQCKKNKTVLQKGNGIGLAISKELTSLLGGTLTVISEVDNGSVFTLQIPIKQIAITATDLISKDNKSKDLLLPSSYPEVIKKNHVVNKVFSVLIVEDEMDMRTYVKELLQDKFVIYEAQHGKEALEILSAKKIDLIISDIIMPEMDGYVFLETLKEKEIYRSIPVIMLTGLNDKANKLQELMIGVDDYLIKPFLPKELIARVDHLLLNYCNRETWNQQYELESITTQTADIGIITKAIGKVEFGWIEEVKQRVVNELENDSFKLSQLAEGLNICERQLQRKIKKITGLSPKQFQQEIALQKARNLLENHMYDNATAVGYSVGIYNVTRFNKLYEVRFGKKPSAYFKNDTLFQENLSTLKSS